MLRFEQIRPGFYRCLQIFSVLVILALVAGAAKYGSDPIIKGSSLQTAFAGFA
jgi:hypothetical protein